MTASDIAEHFENEAAFKMLPSEKDKDQRKAKARLHETVELLKEKEGKATQLQRYLVEIIIIIISSRKECWGNTFTIPRKMTT